MKKTIVPVILILLLLSGCSNPVPIGTVSPDGQPTPAMADDICPFAESPLPTASAAVSDTPNEQEKAHYTVTTEVYTKGKIVIQYPQISGFEDEARENRINDLIKTDILQRAVEKPDWYSPDSSAIEFKLKYTVTLHTKDLLSVLYWGTWYDNWAPHPNNEDYEITIDLQRAEKKDLSDFASIDEDLVQKLKQAKNLSAKGAMESVTKMTTQALTDELKRDSGGNFYLTPNTLVISVSVPHVVGDYCHLEMPWSQLGRPAFDPSYDSDLCLDTETPIISFRIEESKKRVTVCRTNADAGIIYRFGTMDAIELTYGENAIDSFEYSYYMRGGGAANLGLDLNYLTFHINGYTFKIYEEYEAVTNIKLIGIRVTGPAGEETDIKGNSGSEIGGLVYLRDNKIRNMITKQ